MRILLFSFGEPGRTTVTSIGLGRVRRFGNELTTVTLVVVWVSELAVELKLRRSVLPFFVIIVEHTLALIVGNIDALQSVENGCHSVLRDVICIGTLVELE